MARRRLLLPVASLGLGLLLSPVVAEGVCWIADDGAFPHLNVYIPDGALGVRLEPGSNERISFSGNPVSSVRINKQGFRGPDWGDGAGDDIVLVGDSQAFGLGVDEGDSAAVIVDRRLHRTVLNAAVPTYGPEEYLATVAELLDKRPVGHVVIMLNASNDFFELSRPNRDRHRVWDGWAVRSETAPEAVENFPGRSWLYGKSHAFFAWRRWRHEPLPTGSLPSEGRPADLLSVATVDLEPQRTAEKRRYSEERRLVEAARADAIVRADRGRLIDVWTSTLGYDGEEIDFVALAVSRGAHPGDIIDIGYGEGSRSVALTAQLLEEGARMRQQVPERARAWLKENPEGEGADQLRIALAAADGTPAAATAMQDVAPQWAPESPFHDYLLRARALVKSHQAELSVVVLPLDVTVSEAEWAKYGATPQDMSAASRLLDEVAQDGRELGIRMLQPQSLLAAAEPGAFLDGDLHLSPKGQQVLGEALAELIRGPAPVPRPGPGLPEGRSRVPLAEEWALPTDMGLGTGVPRSCHAQRVREWVRLQCEDAVGIGLTETSLEALWALDKEGVRVVFPVSRPSVIDIHEPNRTFRFKFEGDAVTAEKLPASHPPITALPAPISTCELSSTWTGDVLKGCEKLVPDCFAMTSCADGSRLLLPHCGPDQANAGSSGHCFDRCDEAHPCVAGLCTPWQGSAVCL